MLWAHGILLGPTDDEAYYWVLGQHPQWGYAYHPPAIGWVISLFQFMLGWLFGPGSVAVLRLPAALITATIVRLALSWFELAGAPQARLGSAATVLLSLGGVFAASWMMVPDLPLILGWMILFRATWRICFSNELRNLDWVLLVFGALLALLSKYSAVLSLASAAGAILFWAPRARRLRALTCVLGGGALAMIPLFLATSVNGWGSLRYQLFERHHGEFSALRYLRFWAIQLAIAGPTLIYFGLMVLPQRALRGEDRASRYVWLWVWPAALVFCVQPAMSDFKFHWSLVVWFPAALGLALEYARGGCLKLARFQRGFGLSLIAIVAVMFHVPLLSLCFKDPKIDVGNDLHGWDQLPFYLKNTAEAVNRDLPIVGSRYQTASRAALAMRDPHRVELIPRDQKQWAEWPQLGVAESPGPDWPKLLKPVLFVGDNRYTAGPEFKQAQCRKLTRLETTRVGRVVRWIDVWRCDPIILNSSG